MAILHTVNKSPFERNSLESCLRFATSGSAVLLIEDGVYAAVTQTVKTDLIASVLSSVKIYALGPDLSARGVMANRLIPGVQIVDYGGFVDLVAEYDLTQAWL